MENQIEFISVTEKLPEKSGMYIVKTLSNEFPAFYVLTLAGTRTWLLHTDVTVTHWKDTDLKLF